MPRPRRVIGYARVSSAQQALGTSLADQQEAIRSYAASRGLTVDRFYVEAESAIHEKLERREQIQALMRDVQKDDLVICDKLDRWSRDAEFAFGSIKKILAAGASFYAVSDRCDPGTSEGDTTLGFRVVFAREEHKRIRERTVGTRHLLRDQGYYVEGPPPFGYRRSHPRGHKGIEKNVLVIIEKDAAVVRRIFDLAIAGKSIDSIAELVRLKRDRVHDALARRLYAGELQNTHGEWIKGRHPPIIDAGTFAAARACIDARRLGGVRPRSMPTETSDWILRDVARCLHCGGRMTSAWAGAPGPARRHYYKCRAMCRSRAARANTRAYVPVRAIEAAASPLVVLRLAELREELATAPGDPEPKTVDVSDRLARIAKRRLRHLEAHADDLMTRDELRAALGKLDLERQRLEAEAHSVSPSALAEPAVRRAVLRELTAIAKAWPRVPGEERRRIVNLLASSVAIANGEPPRPVWRPARELAAPLE